MFKLFLFSIINISTLFCIQADHNALIESSLRDSKYHEATVTNAKYGLLNEPNFTKVSFDFDYKSPLSSICGVNVNARADASIQNNLVNLNISPSASSRRPTTPAIFPCGGSYEKSVTVTLGYAIDNTRIYYKTNHNPNIVFYDRPIIIKQNTTLTAFRLSLDSNPDNHLSQEVYGIYTFPDELLIRIISLKVDQIDMQNVTLSTHLNIEANDTMKIQYRWYFDSVSQSTKYQDMQGPVNLSGPLVSPVGTFEDMYLQARIIYRSGEEISRTQIYKVRFSKDLKTLSLLNIYNEKVVFGAWLR
ncbi:MAG: chitobiase/beta-hexosaminidase C-terminal domain-containing protein [Candidatus Cloacimonetes bacterium]|nr:chitobiase/beta-hexosaminidase C-terminal domain-containing protein [Candidatus Cloacimonadota bacterium]